MTTVETSNTLQLKRSQGFPGALHLDQHIRNQYIPGQHPLSSEEYHFKREGLILYPRAPDTVLLVEERRGGKLLYWGDAVITAQTLFDAGDMMGKFRLVTIHDPFYQLLVTLHKFPIGDAFIPGKKLLALLEHHHGEHKRKILEERITLLERLTAEGVLDPKRSFRL